MHVQPRLTRTLIAFVVFAALWTPPPGAWCSDGAFDSTDVHVLHWPSNGTKRRERLPLVVVIPGLGTSASDYEWLTRAAGVNAAVLKLRSNQHYTANTGIVDLSRTVQRLRAAHADRLCERTVFVAHSMGTRAAHRSARALQHMGYNPSELAVIAFGVALVPHAILEGRRYAAVHVTGTEDCMTPPPELAWTSWSNADAPPPTLALLARGANHRFWTDSGDGGRYALAAGCHSASRTSMHAVGGNLLRVALAAPGGRIIAFARAYARTRPAFLNELLQKNRTPSTSRCCCELLQWPWCA